MILDERTYAIKPAHVRDYLDLYVREGMDLQVSHLGHLIGWFTTDSGVVNEVVHMWRFADAGDRERRREAMEADPRWQEFRAKAAPYVLEMRSRSLGRPAFRRSASRAAYAWKPASGTVADRVRNNGGHYR